MALWHDLGLRDLRLEINSLGQPAERLQHRLALIEYLEQHAELLDEDARRRLHSNPLRILDTKNSALQTVVAAAPRLLDFLGQDSLSHFNTLRSILDANAVAYSVNPRLVRGMDYYNLTVFEFVTDRLGAQGTVCAGGRYDYLIEQLGGKSAPAVGWALGVDRLLELLKEQGQERPDLAPDAYAVVAEKSAMPLVLQQLQALRALGVSIQMQASADGEMASLKSQFKRADASGARFALVFGADEISRQSVTLKSLRDRGEAQISHAWADIAVWGPTLQSPT